MKELNKEVFSRIKFSKKDNLLFIADDIIEDIILDEFNGIASILFNPFKENFNGYLELSASIRTDSISNVIIDYSMFEKNHLLRKKVLKIVSDVKSFKFLLSNDDLLLEKEIISLVHDYDITDYDIVYY